MAKKKSARKHSQKASGAAGKATGKVKGGKPKSAKKAKAAARRKATSAGPSKARKKAAKAPRKKKAVSMSVPFESVYRVSARSVCPSEAEIDSLSRDLGIELPVGYREYATTFGRGAMCAFLIVRMPEQIRAAPMMDEDLYRDVFDLAAEEASGDDLNATDFEHATVLAYSYAEAPFWFTTRTQGQKLFEHVDCSTFEIENGFFGLVERCRKGQNHEFPYFEPKNGRRRLRQLYIRPGIGRAGFVDALTRRWGRDSVRCSRSSDDEMYPHYFVSPIEGDIELHLDPNYNRLPGDAFFVRLGLDVDSEADFAAFVEPMLLPGGGPYESAGTEPFWLPRLV